VEAIAEDLLGLSVGESYSLDVSGVLLPAERRIWLNASEGAARRRFTLAHELGHWVCQCLEGRPAPVYCRSDEVGVGEGRTLEREANVFAAELLMSESAVREVWEEMADVAACSTRFAVSPTAMQWRLYTFALVPDRPDLATQGGS
jgi:Zn-dependent peptidase ImmA (M78 family)